MDHLGNREPGEPETEGESSPTQAALFKKSNMASMISGLSSIAKTHIFGEEPSRNETSDIAERSKAMRRVYPHQITDPLDLATCIQIFLELGEAYEQAGIEKPLPYPFDLSSPETIQKTFFPDCTDEEPVPAEEVQVQLANLATAIFYRMIEHVTNKNKLFTVLSDYSTDSAHAFRRKIANQPYWKANPEKNLSEGFFALLSQVLKIIVTYKLAPHFVTDQAALDFYKETSGRLGITPINQIIISETFATMATLPLFFNTMQDQAFKVVFKNRFLQVLIGKNFDDKTWPALLNSPAGILFFTQTALVNALFALGKKHTSFTGATGGDLEIEDLERLECCHHMWNLFYLPKLIRLFH